MAAKRNEITAFLNQKLSIADIEDSSNNGLQVEGKDEVKKIGLAVDACMDVYKKAASLNCDMLIVHHGLIWNGIKFVTGRYFNHLKFLIENGMGLYAAHIPLDMHDKYGNNIELAKILGLSSLEPFGNYKGLEIGFSGKVSGNKKVIEISETFQKILGGTSVILPFGKETVSSVGIVSGGAADILDEAVEKGLDCFVTGEGSYSVYHPAKEAGINVIFLGHYHSEKLGVIALGKMVEKEFGVETVFIDEPTIENHY